jgi:hypothetical protein
LLRGSVENGNGHHGNFKFHCQRDFLGSAAASCHREKSFQGPDKRKTASLACLSTGWLQSPNLESLIILLIDSANDHCFDAPIDSILSRATSDLVFRSTHNVPIGCKIFSRRTSSLACAAANYHDIIVLCQLDPSGLTENDGSRGQTFRTTAHANASLCEELVDRHTLRK